MAYWRKLSVVGANEGPSSPAVEKLVEIPEEPLGRKFSPELKFQELLLLKSLSPKAPPIRPSTSLEG
jgi:hypothetical protein